MLMFGGVIVIIKYGCVTLRPFEDRDLELLHYMINDPEIESGTVGYSYPVSLEQQKEFMKNWRNSSNGIKLMIELSNKKTIGMVSIESIDWKNRTCCTGYKLHAAFEDRIRGDIRDAMIGLHKYIFEELGMNCSYGVILEDNVFSRKLIRSLNGVEEGILRERVYKNGQFKNLVSYSTTKSEFEKIFEEY